MKTATPSKSRIETSLRKEKRGSALILVLVFVLIFSTVIGIMLKTARVQTESVWRTQAFDNSLAAGQTALQSMVNNIVFIVNNRPPSLKGSFTNLNPFIHALVPDLPSGYHYASHDGERLAFVRDLADNSFAWNIVDEPGDPWDGYQTVRLDYELVTMVREEAPVLAAPGFDGVGLRKRVLIDYVPLYQFAMFYHDGELELHPGPVMNVRGRVHTNADLRLSAVDKLYFHELVTAAGRFYKGGGSEQGENQSGHVYFREKKGGLGNWKSFKTGNTYVDSTWDDWASRALSMWDSNLRDQSHGVREITPPLPQGSKTADMIQRAKPTDSPEMRDVKFEYQADIVITGDPGHPGTITARTADGTAIATTFVDAGGNARSYVKVGEFFDGQQCTVVKTLDIDLGRLREFLDLNPHIEFDNGVLYASCTPGQGDSWTPPTNWSDMGRDNYMAAVRVQNAAHLPRGTGNGFTFATDRPLYTTGNINTTDKIASVFCGDALTVCSQELTLKYSYEETYIDNRGRTQTRTVTVNGNTEEKTRDFLRPTASETRTNAIFVMGNTPTEYTRKPSPGDPFPPTTNISGGAHNVMRYLENWSSRRHYFSGSMIVLYASQFSARHHYNKSPHQYYNPPIREYDWDSSLKTAVPPPGMPYFFTVTEGEWQIVSKDYVVKNMP